MDTFFLCPKCGNDKEFKIFTTNYQDIKQSSDFGMRVDESDFLPSLRQGDTHIECKRCFQKIEYDNAATIRKKYIQATQRLLKIQHAVHGGMHNYDKFKT
ncbi:MAG: hypothetical protein ACE5GV_07555 [Candidatus Scalindua sp.]